MSKEKVYIPLNNQNSQDNDEFDFKVKSDKTRKPSKNLFTKFKNLINSRNTKSKMNRVIKPDEAKIKTAGGFDMTPVPQHRRGASFYIGNHRSGLLDKTNTKTKSVKRGSILTRPFDEKEITRENLDSEILYDKENSGPSNLKEIDLKSKTSLELEDIAANKKSIVSLIEKLYKSWSNEVESISSDSFVSRWNFIHNDSTFTTEIEHTLESFRNPEQEYTIKIKLNGVQVLQEKVEDLSVENSKRFTIKPEDFDFTLDFVVESIDDQFGSYLYNFYLNRSPFERSRLRWVRDKTKEQMVTLQRHHGKGQESIFNMQEINMWKNYTTTVPNKRRTIVRTVYIFSVDGFEHNATIEIGTKNIRCYIDKNEIDLSSSVHTKETKVINGKPKKIAFFCGFKPCTLEIEKNYEKEENEAILRIAEMPFNAIKWVLNNL